MKNIHVFFGLLLLFILQSGCDNRSRKIENIQTFSKVYGYVRWFYPGDEAAQVNWNKFAVYGINKVANAHDHRELKILLQELFKPIAPAILIEDSSTIGDYDLRYITPNNITDFKPIFWKHYGVYLSDKSNMYQSIRINRRTSNDRNFCLIKFIPDITKYWGKEVKVTVSMKSSNNSKGTVSLSLNSSKTIGIDFYKKIKKDISIKPDDQWKDYEISIKVNQNDTYILFGLDIDQLDHLYISDIKLMERENETWNPVKNFNSDFNDSDWQKNNFLFNYFIDSSQTRNGINVMKITSLANGLKIGDLVRKNIGKNLVCIMPLVLYGTDKQTYPLPDTVSLAKLNEQLNSIPDSDLSTKKLGARLANVVIAWNVLQHFYPYFDVIDVDWEKVLPSSLKEVYKGKTEADYYKTLCRMIAKLEDGHGVVSSDSISQWGLPLSFAWIENEVIITGSKSSLFQRGDIIKNIDGKTALEELITQESLVSGSPQLKRYRALNIFGTDFEKTKANITLIRDNKTLHLKAKRELKSNLFFNPIGFSYIKNGKHGEGIYYSNSKEADFDKDLTNLLLAKGIVVAPLSYVSKLIPHIIKEPVWSPIMDIPVTTYPDREKVMFDSIRWKIDPQKPFINAELVFIEEPYNVSSGETYLSFIDYYKLGKLVGDTTAGTNGNVNFIPLMGGYSIMWTGMKVLKQDGSQHHLIGYRPDYPVKRTIKAIKESRNEYFEKAIEILK